MKKKILFICGSRNQTTQMHQIAQHLMSEYDCWLTPYYASGHVELMRRAGLTEMTIMGKHFVHLCLEYLNKNNLQIDYGGKEDDYDLVLTCADLVLPKNIRDKKIILVQEGMTDPENFAYLLAKFRLLPRWTASTATMGLSDEYDKFCVASEGYKELFISKGVKSEKIVVTGIPNFDNCKRYLNNNFSHKHFVLVCTSDARETFKFENRKKVILNAVKIANGRKVIFKLHPNENLMRAKREIMKYAPGALVMTKGSAEEMIANCDVLITQYSSTVYVGLALGKEVYSNFPTNELKRLLPLQNSSAAENIAAVCRELVEQEKEKIIPIIQSNNVLKKISQMNYKEKFAQLFAKAS